jgi:predicted CXXCH cytochrome family protein
MNDSSSPILISVSPKRRLALVLAAALLATAGATWLIASRAERRAPATTPDDPELVRRLPRTNAAPGFVTSQQCRECHAHEYATWHASYHRQMTQVARPETVLGPFDGTIVKSGGQRHRLVRKGDELWVESSSDSTRGTAADTDQMPVTARRAVLTTGAHHMQAYWAADGSGNRLQELPVVYLRDPRPGKSRWAPLEASYISETPEGLESKVHWNTDCILCHATGGVPGLEPNGATDTAVGELGISCEACHGPGREHVRIKREQATVAQNGALRDEREAIVNPARLHPERAAQVCGHCHAAAMFATQRLMEDFLLSGSAYRPGDDLLRTRIAVLPAWLTAEQNEQNRQYNISYEGSFWSDGMIRVTGREYNGLVQSTCYQKGGMTCLSCHSMHQSEPDDQLSTAGRGNEACYQCHALYRDNLESHTHHLAGSSGSQCYNCHMPHTTYGLFKAIRSHQITSPSVAVTLATGRPSACNLCHLDQTLAWTDDMLAQWYGQAKHDLTEEQQALSAAAVLILKGDAAQRVLTAWATGWRPALEASGSEWLAPIMAPLLDDPSPVVRLVTSWSLSATMPQNLLDYDFVGEPAERRQAVERVLAAWKRTKLPLRNGLPARVLIKPDGDSDAQLIQRLLRQRDDRGLFLRE